MFSRRGDTDKTKWIWTKSSCSATEAQTTAYTDDKCTIKGGDGSWDKTRPLTCTDGQTIKCGLEHDVAIAKSHRTNTETCNDGTYIGDTPLVMGVCHTKRQSSVVVGMKATRDGNTVVMNKYTAFDCDGTGAKSFTVSSTCAQGYEGEPWLMLDTEPSSFASLPVMSYLLIVTWLLSGL